MDLLSKKRIDFFPRGITEIISEYERFNGIAKQLVIEPSSVLYVPLPVYFFVNPHKPKLARRLTKGLDNIIENGTYDKIFDQYFAAALGQLNFDQRTLFKLDNPELSPESLENLNTFWGPYRKPSLTAQ